MKQLYKHLFLIMVIFLFSCNEEREPVLKQERLKTREEIIMSDRWVYICTGRYAKRFHHYPECPGLNNCSGTIRGVDEGIARQRGYTPCKRCIYF